jgi:hypothetical protein
MDGVTASAPAYCLGIIQPGTFSPDVGYMCEREAPKLLFSPARVMRMPLSDNGFRTLGG